MLDIKNINVSYGQIRVLKNVSFDVKKGEIVSLVGANGAGKSTLLNSISGLVPIENGEIFFQEKRIDHLQSHEIVELGIIQIPEGRRIFPYMNVKENLEMGTYNQRAKGKKKDSLRNVYELFPILAKREKQLGGSLSGGEQQILAISRGLMAMPEILMLDEPSLGLAPIAVKIIFHVLKQINQQGVTVLLVEQNVKKSLDLSTRGYVLENGQIVLEGTGEDLLQNNHLRKVYLGI